MNPKSFDLQQSEIAFHGITTPTMTNFEAIVMRSLKADMCPVGSCKLVRTSSATALKSPKKKKVCCQGNLNANVVYPTAEY